MRGSGASRGAATPTGTGRGRPGDNSLNATARDILEVLDEAGNAKQIQDRLEQTEAATQALEQRVSRAERLANQITSAQALQNDTVRRACADVETRVDQVAQRLQQKLADTEKTMAKHMQAVATELRKVIGDVKEHGLETEHKTDEIRHKLGSVESDFSSRHRELESTTSEGLEAVRSDLDDVSASVQKLENIERSRQEKAEDFFGARHFDNMKLEVRETLRNNELHLREELNLMGRRSMQRVDDIRCSLEEAQAQLAGLLGPDDSFHATTREELERVISEMRDDLNEQLDCRSRVGQEEHEASQAMFTELGAELAELRRRRGDNRRRRHGQLAARARADSAEPPATAGSLSRALSQRVPSQRMESPRPTSAGGVLEKGASAAMTAGGHNQQGVESEPVPVFARGRSTPSGRSSSNGRASFTGRATLCGLAPSPLVGSSPGPSIPTGRPMSPTVQSEASKPPTAPPSPPASARRLTGAPACAGAARGHREALLRRDAALRLREMHTLQALTSCVGGGGAAPCLEKEDYHSC